METKVEVAILPPENHRTGVEKLETRKGVLYGLFTYLLGGFLPVYFKTVAHVSPLEMLAHRIFWSVTFLVFLLTTTRGWGAVRSVLVLPRTLLLLCVTTALIATNWFVFIYSVSSGRILESSLGYFINPMVNVLLGGLFLGERLRKWQGMSILVTAAGVLVMLLGYGKIPWISLILAVTFGTYGLLRKIAHVEALAGVTIETAILAPAALGYLVWLSFTGEGAFLAGSIRDNLLLPFSGILTAASLLWFIAATRRLRLTTMGFLQFITPTLHFLLAVFFYGEPFTRVHLASFLLIWSGLAIYSIGVFREARA